MFRRLGLGIGIGGAGRGPAGPVFFVDSVAGLDSNNGLTSGTAFQTLARVKLENLNRATINLAKGSRFREELTGLPVGAMVRAYGAGIRPIIDGRDIAANASFTKTAGRTNVYQISWSHGFGPDGGKSMHRAWEVGVMMPRAVDLTACDATPGSFFAAAPTAGGPDLVYVHPAGSTNPVTNGRQYALTKRQWCIQLYQSYQQSSVIGLEAIGNSYADGSICADGYVEDCIARDGRYHNAFILGTAVNVQAIGIEASGGSMFVSYYDNSGAFGGPAVRDCIYRGCTADAVTFNATTDGFFVHTDFAGRVFGTIQWEDCRVVSCAGAFAGSALNVGLCYRCTYDDVTNVYGIVPIQKAVLLGGTGKTRNTVNGKLFAFATGVGTEFIAQGLKCYAQGAGEGPIGTVGSAVGASVLIQRCSIYSSNGGAARFFRGNVTIRRTILAGNNLCAVYLGDGGGNVGAYLGDGNDIYNVGTNRAATGKEFGGQVFYDGLAAWRAYLAGVAFSEPLSIEVDPLFADAANLNFAIGSAPVNALGAGAAVDELTDPVLQAYWTQYRVG